MIIFISDPNLIPLIESKTQKRSVVYNLSSMYSGYKDITYLMTNMRNILNPNMVPMNIFVDMPSFDIAYAQMLMNDRIMFTLFMDVIQCNFMGMNAIILVYRDYYRDSVMESIIKLIQQNYGINSWVIESADDIECIAESLPNPYSITTLDNHLSIYLQNIQKGLISNPVVDMNLSVEY